MEFEKDYLFFVKRFIVDTVTIFIAWFGSYFLRFYVIPGGVGEPLREFSIMFIIVIVLYLFFLNRNKLYRPFPNVSWQSEVQLILYSALEVFLTLTVILYYLYGKRVSRITLALFTVISAVALITVRLLINQNTIRRRAKGKDIKRILIIGFGERIEDYITEILATPLLGFEIVGQFGSDNKDARVKQYEGNLNEIIEQTKPQIVVIGYPSSSRDLEKQMISECYDLIQKVMVIPDLPYSLIGSKIVDFHSIPIMQLNDVSISFFQSLGKRLLDFVFTLIGTVVISPLLLVIAILVKVTSPGPIFYRQERVTIDGKTFWMLKFRSMADRPLGEEDCKWTTKDDPRITKFGKFIRKTSLDELPQLFNVLKGDMSLIGPRPERPELVDKFIHEIPGYQLRHKVKAGITGWAQVNGYRGDTSLVTRIEYDLEYIKNWSFLFDIKIFILTFIKGFINKNAY